MIIENKQKNLEKCGKAKHVAHPAQQCHHLANGNETKLPTNHRSATP